MGRWWVVGGPLMLLASACGEADSRGASAQEPVRASAAADGQACRVVRDMALPAEVRESSGLARSVRDPNLFWTHNDAGNSPELFAVDAEGHLVQRVRVAGAELVDWEDIESGQCGGTGCLYVGDIGDNDGDRERVTVYRFAEPAAGATETEAAQPLHARYPDGPRDAESLFADAAGTLYLVTKGRGTGISLYRWPASVSAGETVTLERVRDLFPQPADDPDLITAASASPRGQWVGIRSYRRLYLFRTEDLLGGGDPAAVLELGRLGHVQGESLVLGDDGTVWVSSEAEDAGTPRWSQLECTFPTG